MMETHQENEPCIVLVPNPGQTTKMTKLLVCPECPVLFKRNQALLRHRIGSHGFIPPFNCDLCTVIIATQEDYNKHMATHSKGKKNKCKICGKVFAQLTSLTRHMRYNHTKERPYRCDFCEFSAVEQHKLTIHLRIHTGEAPYMCKECGSCFKSNVSLKRHLATHSKTKDYICVLCFKQFRIGNTLRTHMLKVHAVQNHHIEGVHSGATHGIGPLLQRYFDSLTGIADIADIDRSTLRYYHIREEFTRVPGKHFKDVADMFKHAKRAYDHINNKQAKVDDKSDEVDAVEPTRAIRVYDQKNNKEEAIEPTRAIRVYDHTVEDALENAQQNGFAISVDDSVAPLNHAQKCKNHFAVHQINNEEANEEEPIPVKEEPRVGDSDNRSDFVELSEDPDTRRELLCRMKGGEFGYRPRVIRVLDDGTIVNVTDKYTNSLPDD